MTTSPEPALRLEGVDKRFGATHAVRDLSLVVPRGSLCGFLGPNGAGKSTTIRMVMSIIAPDAGSVQVLGSDAAHRKDRIGYLPETRGLYPKMRVGEYLGYIAKLKGRRDGDLRALAKRWLERLDLGHALRLRCRELSKGMQQKVQILAALIHEPELLILDEPFSGLDPVNVERLSDLVAELRARGVTILFSTHVLDQAERLCDRVVLVHHGRKLLDATLDEVQRQFDPRTVDVELLAPGALAPDLPGVHAVEQHSDRRYELHLDADAQPQATLQAVVARHAVQRVALRRLTLREVFVQLVGGPAPADEAA